MKTGVRSLALLQLRFPPLAWELPYATGVALKRQERKKKEKKGCAKEAREWNGLECMRRPCDTGRSRLFGEPLQHEGGLSVTVLVDGWSCLSVRVPTGDRGHSNWGEIEKGTLGYTTNKVQCSSLWPATGGGLYNAWA